VTGRVRSFQPKNCVGIHGRCLPTPRPLSYAIVIGEAHVRKLPRLSTRSQVFEHYNGLHPTQMSWEQCDLLGIRGLSRSLCIHTFRETHWPLSTRSGPVNFQDVNLGLHSQRRDSG